MRVGTNLVWAAVAVIAGFLVLLGYFLDLEIIQSLRLIITRWAVLLAGAALLIGLFNLLAVHWSKVSEQEPSWLYSLVLILAFVGTIVMSIAFGPDSEEMLLLFEYIQLPVEASLVALLAVSLAVAGFRLVSQRRDIASLIFIGTALIILLGTGPWPISGESRIALFLGEMRNWITQVWATGGARGILLGITLGAIITGVRVLLAVERPYGD